MDNPNRQNDSASGGGATFKVDMDRPHIDEGNEYHVSGRATSAHKDPVEHTETEAIPFYRRPQFGDRHGDAHDTHNPYAAPQEIVRPLKREVLVTKDPVQDFGTSLCLLQGDIYVTDVREARCVCANICVTVGRDARVYERCESLSRTGSGLNYWVCPVVLVTFGTEPLFAHNFLSVLPGGSAFSQETALKPLMTFRFDQTSSTAEE